jgi:hypothetical protein
MKAYLITTCTLFAVMAAVHVWRAIAEWPHGGQGAGFLVEMAVVIVLPGLLAFWAWRLLRGLGAERKDESSNVRLGAD